MADKEAARLAKSIIRESFGELVGVSFRAMQAAVSLCYVLCI